MKNLLNISEEEKSRILEMHETATNKHYLNEQPTVGAGVLAGAAAGSVVPGVGTLVGGVGGAVVGTIISIINGSDAASQKVQKIINNCGNKFPVTSRTNKIADGVYNAISGVGTDEGGVYNAIKASTSIAEFCGVVKSYKDSYGEDLYKTTTTTNGKTSTKTRYKTSSSSFKTSSSSFKTSSSKTSSSNTSTSGDNL